ncbi:ubiquitin-like-conjugating enzyme ATG10 [Watersipora subatra]|uniref:ubiquitin-like-conjugating enzyme ATG10 n=1 Tax=Watersipora subatra TaxID=2589382 RepID=UPI00355B402B
MTGHITYAQFITQAIRLFENSKLLGDQWNLLEQPNCCRQKIQFLVKRCYKPKEKHVLSDMLVDTTLSPACQSEEVDETVTINQEDLITIKYYIIYSNSYSVPVLYFNACHQDGRLLNHLEISEIFSPYHSDCMMEHLWSTVTQVEHPVFQTPVFMLHPCKTASMMSIKCSNEEGTSDLTRADCYLIKWLSSVAPAIGLDISIRYFQLHSIDT